MCAVPVLPYLPMHLLAQSGLTKADAEASETAFAVCVNASVLASVGWSHLSVSRGCHM